jgi:hypothetical protein
MDASVHRGLNQGSNVFILYGSLATDLMKATAVSTVSHRLILQITFASLITDRAVKWVIGEKKFHNSFSRFVGEGRICFHDHPGLHWPCT